MTASMSTQPTVTDNTKLIGRITNFAGNLLQGWVYSEQLPGKRWVVSILADGKQVGLAIADQFHPMSPGDGCHGFRTMLNDDLVKGVNELAICLANEDQALHCLSLPYQDESHTTETSRVLWQPGLCLHGWLVDSQEPDQPLDILVYNGDQLIVRAKPTRWQAIHGKYVEAGFSLGLPLELADGQSHTLSVLDSKGRELQGSPLTIQEWPKGLSSLLQTHSISTEELVPLTLKIAQLCEKVIQPSVRFEDYPLWLDTFYGKQFSADQASNKKKTHKKPLKKTQNASLPTLGIIWLGQPKKDELDKLSQSNAFAIDNFILEQSSQTHTPNAVDEINSLSINEDAVVDSHEYQKQLSMAAKKCDWIVQLHADDKLIDSILDQINLAMRQHSAKLYYTDFDYVAHYPNEKTLVNPEHPLRTPAFLPAFDIDRLWCQNYLNVTLCIASSDIVLSENFLMPNMPEQLSYALVLGLSHEGYSTADKSLENSDLEKNSKVNAQGRVIPSDDIIHIPQIGLHRHDSGLNKTISESELSARSEYLKQYDPLASLSSDSERPQLLRLRRKLDTWPSVTLVIPTRDALKLLKKCIDTFLELTDYPGQVRLIILNNQSQKQETLNYFSSIEGLGEQKIGCGTATVEVLDYAYPFNYASINNFGIKNSSSDVVGLVNNDIEILHPEWLCNMVSLLMRQDTGIVGAKLLWPNGMVQHGGVIGGQFDGLAGHVGNQLQDDDLGYLNNNQITQRFSMVTAACLLIRSEDYWRVSGLNERDFPVGFNDVDLCLKVRALDKAVVWTPEAKLIHAESATRGKDNVPEKAARAQREMHNLRQRWNHVLNNDPAYNPNLSLNLANAPYTALALPPRPSAARTNALSGLVSTRNQIYKTNSNYQKDNF